MGDLHEWKNFFSSLQEENRNLRTTVYNQAEVITELKKELVYATTGERVKMTIPDYWPKVVVDPTVQK